MVGYLFRGKSIVADSPNNPGYWLEGSLLCDTLTVDDASVVCYHIFINDEANDLFFLLPDDTTEVWPETIGQYIGIPDKNGKKIFEGDIVRTKFGRLCVVVWCSLPGHIGWDLKPINTKDNLSLNPPPLYDMFKCLEVVGNIHDNPELLKGEK